MYRRDWVYSMYWYGYTIRVELSIEKVSLLSVASIKKKMFKLKNDYIDLNFQLIVGISMKLKLKMLVLKLGCISRISMDGYILVFH